MNGESTNTLLTIRPSVNSRALLDRGLEMFSNSSIWFRELLQNSRRAKATRVDVTVTFEDCGDAAYTEL